MRLVSTWYGAFLLDGDHVAAQRLFPQDAAALAERYDAAGAGRVLEEEQAVAAQAPEGFDVAEERLLKLEGARRVVLDGAGAPPSASDLGFARELLHDAGLRHAKQTARVALGSKDVHVVQAVDALDDLTEAANLVSERLREWYGLHYPEAVMTIPRHEELAALVSAHTTRDAVQKAKPELPTESFGGDLGEREEAAVKAFSRLTSSIYATRADIEKYLEERLPDVAPNVTKLVGAPIAARLLKLSGGLDRLARLPAGTIQTLGAEKALFRHLKEGARPPKHGVILQHPLVHRAPKQQRGAIARALASKLSFAARADALTHEDVADRLLAELEERVQQVRREAAAKQRRGPARQGRGGRGNRGGRGGPKGGRGRR